MMVSIKALLIKALDDRIGFSLSNDKTKTSAGCVEIRFNYI